MNWSKYGTRLRIRLLASQSMARCCAGCQTQFSPRWPEGADFPELHLRKSQLPDQAYDSYCVECAGNNDDSLCTLCGQPELKASMMQATDNMNLDELYTLDTHIVRYALVCQKCAPRVSLANLRARLTDVSWQFSLMCNRCEECIATLEAYKAPMITMHQQTYGGKGWAYIHFPIMEMQHVAECLRRTNCLYNIYSPKGEVWVVAQPHLLHRSRQDGWYIRCPLRCSASGCQRKAWRHYDGFCDHHWMLQLLGTVLVYDLALLVLEHAVARTAPPADAVS